MSHPGVGPPRGVLGPRSRAEQEHRRVAPGPRLAPFVAHYWWVAWRRAGQPAVEVATLPHPTVHIVFEAGAGAVSGVHTRLFRRALEGDGRAFGIKLRPAAFSPFVARPIRELRDRVTPVEALWGARGAALARAVAGACDIAEAIAVVEPALAERLPPGLVELPPEPARLRDLVEAMEHDRSLVRVEQAAERAGLTVRALQRAFQRFVGVSPKWVIARYRLMEAAERLVSSAPPPLAALAHELGYADQPHFVRDFHRMIGVSPAAYARAACGDDVRAEHPRRRSARSAVSDA